MALTGQSAADTIGAMDDFDDLLRRANAGEPGALEALFATAYDELKKLARSRLRDGGRNSLLDTTALVHECYQRMIGGGELKAEFRRAFFAYASSVMRSVIVDAVRKRSAERRGGDLMRVTFDTRVGEGLVAPDDHGVLDLSAALDSLAQSAPRLAQVVEMLFFGGFTETQVADALDVDPRTVRRDVAKAKRLLREILQG